MTGFDRPATETPLRIEVVRGAPTDEELAALVAVVTEEYTRQEAAAVARDAPERSAWEISARGMREPLRRDLGWTRFV